MSLRFLSPTPTCRADSPSPFKHRDRAARPIKGLLCCSIIGLLFCLLGSAAGAEELTARPTATVLDTPKAGGTLSVEVTWPGHLPQTARLWYDRNGNRLQEAGEVISGWEGLQGHKTVLTTRLPRDLKGPVMPHRVRVEIGSAEHVVGTTARCQFARGFHRQHPIGVTEVLAEWDDGNGSALYLGGSFSAVDETLASNIARWDGSSWSVLADASGEGADDRVYALTVFDDGSGEALYVGGDFETAGGVTSGTVARWDGTTWSALPGWNTAFTGRVYTMAVWDDGSGPALYVGGVLTLGDDFYYLVRWDGTSWSEVAGIPDGGLNGNVRDLVAWDDGSGPALYVGGDFSLADGSFTDRAAKWDGTSWSSLTGTSGVDGRISHLVLHDGSLYAGGSFDKIDGVVVEDLARWDGASWSPVVGPFGTLVNVGGIESYGSGANAELYLSGTFRIGEVLPTTFDSGLFRWQNGDWHNVDETFYSTRTMAVLDVGHGEKLYLAGTQGVSAAGQIIDGFGTWDGTSIQPLSTAYGLGMNGPITALTIHDDGAGPQLIAAGSHSFTNAGDALTNQIARWDGTSWTPFGTGLDGLDVSALQTFDAGNGPSLYAAGTLTRAGETEVSNIARWDGAAWTALPGPDGDGADSSVHALAVYDDGSGPALYVGGQFQNVGGLPSLGLAKWDGSAWSELGTSGWVYALEVWDDGNGPALYVGGSFSTIDGQPANSIARWDGTWSALTGPSGTGVIGRVDALEVHNDGNGPALYLLGDITSAGGVVVDQLARWNGTAWSALSGTLNTTNVFNYDVLQTFDDGTGEQLYIGGDFTIPGENHNLTRWDGADFRPLSGPLAHNLGNGRTRALQPFDDGSGVPGLFVGGQFETAGGIPSKNLAKWQTCAPILFADGFEDGTTSAWTQNPP